MRECEHVYVFVCLLLSFGGNGDDNGQGVAGDANGNVYLVGTFQSTSMVVPTLTGRTTLTKTGNSDIFVIKRNALGKTVWARR
jgi:hypothetical protein